MTRDDRVLNLPVLRHEGFGSDRVECYSGHTYAQEPRAFWWQGQRQEVTEIVARWRTPQEVGFRVETESGQQFELQYDENQDRWEVIRLPREARQPDNLPNFSDKEVLK